MIVLTCGHEIDSFDDKHHNVMIKGYTRQWEKCIRYDVVCPECYKNYIEDGIILENESLAMAWLNKIDNTS